MAEISWSPKALKDIDEIVNYISKDSLQYAKKQAESFFEKAMILEKFPWIGRVVPELQIETIRQLLCGHYRIIYEVMNESHIGIITVHHQSRLLRNNPAIKKKITKRKK